MTFENDNPKRFRIVAAIAGVDDADSSSFVVEAASVRARAIIGAELHLVHVIEDLRFAPKLPEILSPWTGADVRERGRAYLDGMRRLAEATFRGRVVVHLAEGEPWREIVDVAERLHADLVVVGRHERTNLADAPSGFVSDLVVDHAKCRVLIARPPVRAVTGPTAPQSCALDVGPKA